MPGSEDRKEWHEGKMQTEEETAAAEEPILDAGSGREQVGKDIFSPSPGGRTLVFGGRRRKVAHDLPLEEKKRLFINVIAVRSSEMLQVAQRARCSGKQRLKRASPRSPRRPPPPRARTRDGTLTST